LRAYYYAYLLNEVRFVDFAAQPRFSPSARSAETPMGQMLGLVMGVLALVLGAAATGRVRPM
jgi:ABC-2 type transport system permease protein